MRFLTFLPAVALTALITYVLASGTGAVRAQDQSNTAHIGISAPLPVHVTNTPALPEGFGPGSNWRFTTWTTPSVITWTGRILRVSGPWALIQISGEGNSGTTTRWYYVPAMPGSWEKQ